ncbi:MAG: transcriptional regulator [Bacillota bacterium]
MFGLGKPRSRFGKYVDRNGISHGELVEKSGVSKDTVTKACSSDDADLREISKKALVKGLNTITGEKKSTTDFWS